MRSRPTKIPHNMEVSECFNNNASHQNMHISHYEKFKIYNCVCIRSCLKYFVKTVENGLVDIISF